MDDADDGRQRCHIRVLAGDNRTAKPVLEVIPAALIDDGIYEVLGTPGLANGCAAGDVIRLRPSGEFEVLQRGGNLAVQVYMNGLTAEAVDALRKAYSGLPALVETPATYDFAVVTVPVSAGFAAVEGAMEQWQSSFPDAEWFFGNVYDDEGRPLNWW